MAEALQGAGVLSTDRYARMGRVDMVALAIALAFVVLVLGVLVAGLLRSHADILRSLHDLGAGVGDPMADPAAPAGPVPVSLGPPLPGERSSTSAPALAGVTPGGDALAVDPGAGEGLTLLAFLSSGCSSCAGFWSAFARPEVLDLPEQVRLVVVTKGPEFELPAEVGSRAHPSVPVVMSTDAWSDYEVPGSPFFVLVDGAARRRIGEGVANHFAQVLELVRRAQDDRRAAAAGAPGAPFDLGLDGPARELANDQVLRRAGIEPGDPSLYPRSLADLYGPAATGDVPTERSA
jgi:hypothetical protein